MRNILTIIKKELKRFFTDKRMVMSLLLPGIIIYVLYSFMGSFMGDIDSVEDDYTYKGVVINYDNNLDDYFELIDLDNYEITYLTSNDNYDLDEYKEEIKNKDLDLLVIYPENFYNDSINFDPTVDEKYTSPIVEMFYNSSKTESLNLYNIYSSMLFNFHEDISEKFRINFDPNINYDLISEESVTILIITSIVPFLLITFLFSGAMSVSIESIAGEKERGTISTLLATPIKRNELALGKIISLSIISLVSAASSFTGVMLSLPKLMQGIEINMSIYKFSHIALLFFVIMTTTLLYVVLISLVSAFAKSIKEATSLSSIVLIVNMVIGITSMAGMTGSNISYFIPVYNSLKSISDILSLEISSINLLTTSLVNFGIAALGTYILTLMFNSEKVMFNK